MQTKIMLIQSSFSHCKWIIDDVLRNSFLISQLDDRFFPSFPFLDWFVYVHSNWLGQRKSKISRINVAMDIWSFVYNNKYNSRTWKWAIKWENTKCSALRPLVFQFRCYVIKIISCFPFASFISFRNLAEAIQTVQIPPEKTTTSFSLSFEFDQIQRWPTF